MSDFDETWRLYLSIQDTKKFWIGNGLNSHRGSICDLGSQHRDLIHVDQISDKDMPSLGSTAAHI
jgi:hypothetical protein